MHFEQLILAALAVACSVVIAGCSGMGIRAEAYRIDERQETVRTVNQPLKCLFVECGGKNE